MARTQRSLSASSSGIEQARIALTGKKWSQEDLAEKVKCDRQTANKFFTGKPVNKKQFVEICELLGLNWQEVAEGQQNSANIDALVQEVRSRVRDKIQTNCGTMRVLDMTQPIGLGDIYTNVNILEKITGRQRKEIAELLEHCNFEEFDHFGLGRVTEKRVPGIEAAQQHSKLMVLGKPGAGKTTFLKYLAIQCIGGEFQSERIPIFITLKHFAETKNNPELLDFIIKELAKDTVTDTQISELLNNGRILLFLDGLDEVKEDDSKRVITQIEEFSKQYRTNQFVITCRIAAREYTFEQFTEVEVADFDDEQIKTFVNNWFRIKNLDKFAERFLKALSLNKPIKELATNPLLLTLLCLEFEDSGDFPANRSELYKRGTDTLLRKWDKKRGIERDEVYKKGNELYKNLPVQRKEDLLSQIAFTTFERGNYFFKQKEVEANIIDYIRNLPDASNDSDALQLDSEAILKLIEAQHGLIVERAKEIYSFSHLTFQEYFSSRKIVNNSNPNTLDDPALQGLVSHITEKRWREVFLLTAGMLPDASYLLQLMKQQVDALLAGDSKLQDFLSWVNQKALSVDVPYKPSAIRAFYLALDLDLALDFDFNLLQYLNFDFKLNKDFVTDFHLQHHLHLHSDLDLDLVFDPQLQRSIQELRSQLPNYEDDEDGQWWKDNAKTWTEQLRNVIIQYRNIGYDWQFSDKEIDLFMQYYDAHLLLVNCLNSDCYVSREVRQEIEDTLLLPISEIEKRKNYKL